MIVLPFASLDGQQNGWVGRSIQESLVTDLVGNAPLRVSSGAGAATDAAEAEQAARKANARYVLFGQIHTIGDDIRVTAQLLDTQTGHSILPLKATGTAHNLFDLEDRLGEQLRDGVARIDSPQVDSAKPPESSPFEATGPVRRAYGEGSRDPTSRRDYGSAYDRYYFGNPYAEYPPYAPYPTYAPIALPSPFSRSGNGGYSDSYYGGGYGGYGGYYYGSFGGGPSGTVRAEFFPSNIQSIVPLVPRQAAPAPVTVNARLTPQPRRSDRIVPLPNPTIHGAPVRAAPPRIITNGR